jgi:hypothetical protein
MAVLLIWAYLDPCQDVLKLICLEHYICVISPSCHLKTRKCSPISIIYYRACQVQGNCALISERAQLPPLCTLHNVMAFMDLHNGHVEFAEWLILAPAHIRAGGSHMTQDSIVWCKGLKGGRQGQMKTIPCIL